MGGTRGEARRHHASVQKYVADAMQYAPYMSTWIQLRGGER